MKEETNTTPRPTPSDPRLDDSPCSPVCDFPEGVEETWRADAGWQRADEAEAVIEQIRNLVTTDHESKSAFISRVRECLPPKHF